MLRGQVLKCSHDMSPDIELLDDPDGVAFSDIIFVTFYLSSSFVIMVCERLQ